MIVMDWTMWEVVLTTRDMGEIGEVMRLLYVFSGQLNDCAKTDVPKLIDLHTKKDNFYCI